LIPKDGVYVVESQIDESRIFGMMNIGFNPTVGENSKTIEVYYLDFNGDLYGQQITVSILHRLRSEQKFDSLDALKNQLKSDRSAALDFIKKQDN
jgi:riboflavin kinase/FMN adenylyltransferase